MRIALSILMITKNAQNYLERCLASVFGLADEIVVVDDFSTDNTVKILKKFDCEIFQRHEPDRGKQMEFGLEKIKNDWVLVLDSDEIVSDELKKEIAKLLNTSTPSFKGYLVPFQSYFLGKKLYHGGENYKKLILFQKEAVFIKPALIHQKFELKKGRPGSFKNKIDHYSYKSVIQLFSKFTFYGVSEAKQKTKDGEKTSLEKIILNGPHMFWARFVKDKGYKDGLFRIPLDLAFAYMEFLTYFSMLFVKKVKE